MATLRSDLSIDRPPDEVWSVVSDAGNIWAWFPMAATSTATGNQRHCVLEGDVPLEEEIVTNDDSLRRFEVGPVGRTPTVWGQ